MQTIKIDTNRYGSNCYLVFGEDTAVLIDAGGPAQVVFETLTAAQLQLEAILLTHTHFDHIAELETIAKHTDADVYVYADEKEYLQNPTLNLSKMAGKEISMQLDHLKTVTDGEILIFEDLSFEVIHTPGHTVGGVCYYTEGELFSGDTLFRRGIGRTDFPGGNYAQIEAAIQQKLYTLPDATIVYPGHGIASTIAEEKKSNPFVKG